MVTPAGPAGIPGGMGHPSLVTPSHKNTEPDPCSGTSLQEGKDKATKPMRLSTKHTRGEKGEGLAAGSCKGKKTEPKQCKD